MIQFRNRRPTPSSNRTLSGTTTAARPPGLSARTMCSTKASCLFDVSAVIEKSDRVGLPPPFFVPKGGFVIMRFALPIRSPSGDRVSPLSTMLSLPWRMRFIRRTRGEVLPCPGFLLRCVLLQQPFVEVPEPFFSGREPVELVDCSGECLQIGRLS